MFAVNNTPAEPGFDRVTDHPDQPLGPRHVRLDVAAACSGSDRAIVEYNAVSAGFRTDV